MSTPTYTYDRDTKGIDIDAIGAGYATGTVCILASGQISDVWAMIAKANAAEDLAAALKPFVNGVVIDAGWPDNAVLTVRVGRAETYVATVGDLRQADIALAKAEGRA